MDRTDFFNTVNIGNGPEYDHLYNNLSKFKPVYPVQYYRLKGDDIMRMDLVSYKCYGSVNYWWLLGAYNGVLNPLTDMKIGDLYKIPNQLDVYSFYKQYSLV